MIGPELKSQESKTETQETMGWQGKQTQNQIERSKNPA
jgi:hypothetical protein